MEKRKKRVFEADFKANAVQLVRAGGQTVAEVARKLNIVPSVLGTWVKHAEAEEAPEGQGPLKAAEREELVRLRKQVKTLEMERDFAKKAAAFFAKEIP